MEIFSRNRKSLNGPYWPHFMFFCCLRKILEMVLWNSFWMFFFLLQLWEFVFADMFTKLEYFPKCFLKCWEIAFLSYSCWLWNATDIWFSFHLWQTLHFTLCYRNLACKYFFHTKITHFKGRIYIIFFFTQDFHLVGEIFWTQWMKIRHTLLSENMQPHGLVVAGSPASQFIPVQWCRDKVLIMHYRLYWLFEQEWGENMHLCSNFFSVQL